MINMKNDDYCIDSHPQNIRFIFLTFDVFHFEIFGRDCIELHSAHICDIRSFQF